VWSVRELSYPLTVWRLASLCAAVAYTTAMAESSQIFGSPLLSKRFHQDRHSYQEFCHSSFRKLEWWAPLASLSSYSEQSQWSVWLASRWSLHTTFLYCTYQPLLELPASVLCRSAKSLHKFLRHSPLAFVLAYWCCYWCFWSSDSCSGFENQAGWSCPSSSLSECC
jgi:hypothetical protein